MKIFERFAAKIHTFGSAPRHVIKDCERLNGCGFKYSAEQLEKYAKQFV